MVNLIRKHLIIFAFSIMIIVLFSKCNCPNDTYQCPGPSSELKSIIGTFNSANYVFKSDSGNQLILNTVNSIPDIEEIADCSSGNWGSCICNPCHYKLYYELNAIDTSGVIRFWHINLSSTTDYQSENKVELLSIETVTFTNIIPVPLRAGNNIQFIDELNFGGKKYKDVYRIETLDKTSVSDFAFIYLSTVNGIIGFRELGSEQIYYRL